MSIKPRADERKGYGVKPVENNKGQMSAGVKRPETGNKKGGLLVIYKKSAEPELSEKLFENPTAEYRGAPFWGWTGRVEKSLE